MTVTPMLPFLDSDFLAYAGSTILTRSIALALVIIIALRIVDMASDAQTMPSRGHVAIRVIFAFALPLFVFTMIEWSNGMPAHWRRHYDGEYSIGQDMPAGSWAVTATEPGAKVTVRRPGSAGDRTMSYSWDEGTVCVTVMDGDTMEISRAIAKNRTVMTTYNPHARTSQTARGVAFLVAGADIMPGTYELRAITDPKWEAEGVPSSEYEVRDGFVSVDSPLMPTGYDDVAYVDVHYGQVLYVKWTQIDLYSTVFAPMPDAAGDGEEGPATPEAVIETPAGEATGAEGKESPQGTSPDDQGGGVPADGVTEATVPVDRAGDTALAPGEPDGGQSKPIGIHDLIMKAAKDNS